MKRISNNISVIKTIAIIWLLFLVHCGRKQRGVFVFPQHDKIRINKLTLPSIHGLIVQQGKDSVIVSWQPIDVAAIKETKAGLPQLNGYNVYRLVKGYFVPKEPINKKPIQQTTFIDSSKQKHDIRHSYVIRAVFAVGDQIIEGPASQVVSVK